MLVDDNEAIKQQTRRQVVPIFGLLDGENQVIGTAIILKCMLIITAAHTFYNEIKVEEITVEATRRDEIFEILVDNQKFSLGKPVYEEYSWDFNTINDGIYHDLSIYKLPDGLLLQSELVLSITNEGEFRIKGYPFSNEKLYTSPPCIIDNENNSIKTYGDVKRIPKTFTNCFQLNQSITYGMSGGPVLRENEVVGMAVYGPKDPRNNDGSSAIKSKHILKVMKENKLNE